ncbi:hypothetical protein PF011_g13776 [Phytophthora fragariae]|uniref:Uncharacterized protein n=1 Tax=Phytophthora fragariae TaxID=53985 RepID=A0A6A3K2L8_9STRA|nr:hypothetical protein PF011_g13776 [Phytophthora fragariae]
MREGMTRYCLARAEPSTLEAVFALALREDYTVASSYARGLTPDARASAPEPMEIDAIQAESRSRSTSTARGPRFSSDNRPRDFDCILGMPWLARYQLVIDWLARSVRRPVGYDVSEVFTHLLVAPSRHVAVVDRTSTTQPPQRESDDPRCVECAASVIGPVSNPPSRAREGMKKNTIEQWFPCERNANAVEQRFPHPNKAVEQRLPFADDSVAQQDLRNTGMVETEIPCLEEGEVPSSESSSSETSASSSGSTRLRKSKRNRSGRRRLRRRSTAVDPAPSSEILNVVEYSEGSPTQVRAIEVANPPSDAATITRLPGVV